MIVRNKKAFRWKDLRPALVARAAGADDALQVISQASPCGLRNGGCFAAPLCFKHQSAAISQLALSGCRMLKASRRSECRLPMHRDRADGPSHAGYGELMEP